MGEPGGVNGRRYRAWIAKLTTAVALLAIGVPAAEAASGGGPDPSFGSHGWAAPSLPDASVPGRLEAITAVAGGRFLDIYATEPDRYYFFTVIQRREADGALDPSFGKGGSVTVRGHVSTVAEDPAGGVIYGGDDGFGRLLANGSPDNVFGAHAHYGSASTIAFDAQGRIVVGRSNPEGGRYHPHEGEIEVVKYQPDGRPDRAFGHQGVVYLGQAEEGSGELGVLPDGSILVKGPGLSHLAADGSRLPNPESPSGRGQFTSLAIFPDGSFAISAAPYKEPGCTVTRYDAGGSIDRGFAQGGVFTDSNLFECGLAAAPEGDLFIRGGIEVGGQLSPRVLRISASGAPAAGFGDDGAVAISAPNGASGSTPLEIEDLVAAPDGGVVLAGGAEVPVFVALDSSGALDPGFGDGGNVVASASLPASGSPYAMAAEPDGELVVTGLTDSGSTERHPFWMRFSAAGELIPTDSGAPFTTLPVVPTQLRPDAIGDVYAFVEQNERTYLAKFEVDGTLVTTFGAEGLASMPKGFRASSFVVESDGGVTVVGTVEPAERMAAYRLTEAGQPADDFGRHGLAIVRTHGVTEARADSAVPRSGGDIIITGSADERLVAADLTSDGRPRQDFGRGGVFTCRCGGARPARTDVVADRGHLYILDHWRRPGAEGNSLVAIGPAGRLARSLARRGFRPVQVGTPIELFARGDRLIVAGQKGTSSGPAQVREFALDGAAVSFYSGGDTTFVVKRHGGVGRFPVAMESDGTIVFAGARRAKKRIDGASLALLGLNGEPGTRVRADR